MFITYEISLLTTFEHPGGALRAWPGLGILQGAGLAEVG